MEENTNTAATQAENMGNETEVQESDQKLFTQEEVNGFVQSRVARMKAQATKEAQAEYNQKLADLQAREMKLLIKEKLSDRGMPRELADVLHCTDENDIDAKLDTLNRIYGGRKAAETEKQPAGFVQVGAVPNNAPMPHADPVRKAMGLE